MAGHSKWKQIKYKKALTDAKRGKAFSKLARMITVAVKEWGPVLDANARLRALVEKARALGMPRSNVERAINRGSGKTNEAALEEVFYEAYGPAGSAFLLEGITDSKNRTTSEIKHLLSGGSGCLATEGGVSWLFSKTQAFEFLKNRVSDKDALELELIDAGAHDIQEVAEMIFVYTEVSAAEGIKKILLGAGIAAAEEHTIFTPKNPLVITDETVRNKIVALYEALDDHDDIQNVYTNVEL